MLPLARAFTLAYLYGRDVHHTTAQYSIHYEKACILFNIAAISSQIAEVQNRTTPEGLKKASHFFQLAAGTFEQVSISPQRLARRE